MAHGCVHRNTYEENQADQARLPWHVMIESLRKVGISQNEFKDYDAMVHDRRVMSLLSHRHLGFDMANQLQQPQPDFDGKGLLGFVAYGFKLKEKDYLPGVKIHYLGYKCNACNVLSLDSPLIQTITGRDDPIELSLHGGRTYPGEGIIYSCGNCNRDMLVKIVKDPIIRKRDP